MKILPFVILAATALIFTSACNRTGTQAKSDPPATSADQGDVEVGIALVTKRPVAQTMTLSSELDPDQEIDVYAKVAGYVKTLNVDYGAHVHKDQVMAVLEVPELQAQLDEDTAAIKAQQDQVSRTKSDVDRAQAQHKVAHLEYQRIAGVNQKTGQNLVAQQEIDDAQGKDLADESTVASAQGAQQVAESQLAVAKARLAHDQALYDYSKIIAPFDGVVTQRYANLGALMQAGTSSTQATPLVRLSMEDPLRLVIPVDESAVKYIHVGDPVEVRVPSVNLATHGKVARFSVDVNGNTRTMHTEVDVPNPNGKLIPGMDAEADITLDQNANAVVVPQLALDKNGDTASVLVVDSNNKIEKRTVAMGIQTPDYVEATSGVNVGDRVVVSDRSALKPGETVTPKEVQQMAYGASGPQ